MVQINCTVVNFNGVNPTLQVGVITYIAKMESPTRAIFELSNNEITKQALFIYGNNQTLDFIVPGIGSTEGPVLNYNPLIEQITINGDRFLLPDGTDFLWCGNIDFMLFFRSLDGIDIGPILDQRYSVGSRIIVTLMMAYYIENRDPKTYGGRFFDHMKPFARALAARGFYWMPICLADAQVVMPDKNQQISFVRSCAQQFAGEFNIFPSLGNELSKNGVDPFIFNKPTGNYWSRGSEVGNEPPPNPKWDWCEWHPRRDWPKVLFGNDNAWYVKEGVNADGQVTDRISPIVISEPIGFWDRDIPGRRSSDPNLARVIGGTARYFGRGVNFMSQEGLRCEMYTPRTEECGRAMFNAMRQV